KPKLYGISGSRALRSIWAIEEMGIDYEHVSVNYMEESKNPDFLAVNPNGRIPALVDGDLTVFESMAINMYLAKTYGGDLYPDNAADEALTWQWTIWGISEIEPLQMQLVMQKLFTPEDKRNDRLIASAEKQLERPLAVLNNALEGRDYLLGEHFSVADINLSGVILLLSRVEFDYSAHTNVKRWADTCHARPALARAKAL
ncbi:MAG TPA: glutathione S-transferase family protein, partial [Sneathiellales bacterium]|nr:glutathione S-transferase family protein [Sneathiellales bacterium]